MISHAVHCPNLVGRRRELDFLVERAVAAGQGQGSVVLVEGDGGVGKTRLLSELSTQLAQLGIRQVTGSCFAYASAPLNPLVMAIRELLRSHPECAPDEAGRTILTRLIPELGEGAKAEPPLDGSERLQQFEALLGAFRKAARAAPTVVQIEDLHWADAATLDFIQHAARTVADARLCIVCTCRSSELARGNRLRNAMAKLDREPAVWRLELGPLDDDEMRAFITEAVPRRGVITAETGLEIRRRSEGNPLFAEELLRSALVREGKTQGPQLPRSLEEAVVERLAKIEESDRALIVTAAAVGRKFSPDFIAAVSGVSIEKVWGALRSAIELQLVSESGDRGTVEFRHELTREAVYSELLTAQTRPLHKRIAQALEAAPDGQRRLSELAYQWWSAGEPLKAAAYNERAGDAAAHLHAWQDAVVYFGHALDGISGEDPRRGALLRKWARALHQSGFGARARGAYEKAIEAFLSRNEVDEAAATLISLAGLLFTLQDVAGHRRTTARALELIGDRTGSPAWFDAHVQAAWTKYLDDPTEALRLLGEAERIPANASHTHRVRLFECRALIDIPQGRPSEALDNAEAASQLALAVKDIASAVRSWGNVGLTAVQCGERSLAQEAFRHAITLIDAERPIGWPVPWALALQANSQLLYGNLIEAERTVSRALSAIVDFPSLDVLVAWVALPLGLRLDNAALVERCVDETLVEYAFSSGSSLIGDVATAFFEYFAAKGRLTEGVTLLERALDTLGSPPAPGDYDSMFVLVAQHCDERRARRANELLGQMARTMRVRSIPAYQALARAWTERRFGDPQAAALSALEAAKLFEALEWPIYRAQALEVAGRPEAALELYRSIGDRADARRLEAGLASKQGGRDKTALSKRESEVAQLVAAGKSNREIAEMLFLSERTVESHVSSVLGKLQVTSRFQLAERFKASAQRGANRH